MAWFLLPGAVPDSSGPARFSAYVSCRRQRLEQGGVGPLQTPRRPGRPAGGLRIGEAAGLHLEDIDLDNGVIYVRRSVWNGQELEPKTENAVREIDIDPSLAALLRDYIGSSRRTRLFEARNGAPLSAGNIRSRVLHPLLAKLGIPKAGLHAFRHSRVTLLRKNGTPADLQKLWIGHSSLRTTDRYAHTDQELDYRRRAASRVGLDLIVGPNVASWTQSASEGEEPAKATA
jgi:integrase